MLDIVNRFLAEEDDVVVTLTAPLDRKRPNNDKDRIKLRNLHTEAKARVLQANGHDASQTLLCHLDDAVERVDLGAGGLGYIVVATAHDAETHLLPFPVAEGITIGTSPATRSLIQGLRRSPRYRLLVVSDKAMRLFEGLRDDLHEVTDHGFPFTADVQPRDLRAIAGRFARQPGGDDKEQWRNFYRSVDRALTEAIGDDPLPIILTGVGVSTSMFEDVSVNTQSVLGHISGAHEHTTPHELGTKAWPLLRAHLKARRREVIAELSEAIHSQKAVTGIVEAWQLARAGRGQTLVVEEDYRAEAANEVDHRLVTSSESGQTAIMDDPVDQLIEHVVRNGGNVEFVAPDALAHLDRIGLILR